MNQNHRSKLATSAQAMSSLEIWPRSDYSEYMPQDTSTQRIGQYWTNTGRYLIKAVSTIKEDRTYGKKGHKPETDK